MSNSNETPFFSIVIPTYNRSEVIGPTLSSVQEQTFKDFECLVVDDGSLDGDQLSAAVAALGDERFRYVRQNNGGASSARNHGFDVARGAYIALLDSDDQFLPHKLERCSELLQDLHGDILLYSQMVVERGLEKKWIRPLRGPRPSEPVDEYILCTPGTIRTSTIVVSASIARQVRFDESLPWFQDSDFAIRVANTGAPVVFINEPLIVLEDKVGYSRVSRDANYAPVLEYFDRMRAAGEISERAYWAGRGWPCARVASSSNRPYAMWLYMQAAVRRVFPWRQGFIVAAQVMLPYRFYQAVANLVVRLRGRRMS
ncbi:glycosyltransferase family 2 protein [Mycobacterium sp. NAZ190054]|uniref:glycosyltransferase family 2 protein n=1 Tax=Mycobacterium sp. NAZ190054 TaxID=1747766 RepID=UPI0009EC9D78|nr:glycosyltransferase family 2 protein [Mycobacterium sp. NAZ190054]